MTSLPEQFRHLTPPERIALAQALLESVADDARPSLSAEEMGSELARRAAEDDANPDDVIPWEDAKADIMARLGRP